MGVMRGGNSNCQFFKINIFLRNSVSLFLRVENTFQIASGLLSFLFVLFLATGCRNGKTVETLFTRMENTGINFENTVEDGAKENSFLFRNFYNGGGVAIGDINNDGLADVFLTSNASANKL